MSISLSLLQRLAAQGRISTPKLEAAPAIPVVEQTAAKPHVQLFNGDCRGEMRRLGAEGVKVESNDKIVDRFLQALGAEVGHQMRRVSIIPAATVPAALTLLDQFGGEGGGLSGYWPYLGVSAWVHIYRFEDGSGISFDEWTDPECPGRIKSKNLLGHMSLRKLRQLEQVIGSSGNCLTIFGICRSDDDHDEPLWRENPD